MQVIIFRHVRGVNECDPQSRLLRNNLGGSKRPPAGQNAGFPRREVPGKEAMQDSAEKGHSRGRKSMMRFTVAVVNSRSVMRSTHQPAMVASKYFSMSARKPWGRV